MAHSLIAVAVRGLLLAATAALLAACSSYRNHAYRLGEKAHVNEPQFDLYFVEADDEGWFWEPRQATQALDAIRQSAAADDTLVILYVAGWHHSAECCDDNIEGFKEVLRRLDTELRKPMYAAARGFIHSAGQSANPVKVLGVYMGWRGRSLPGYLDYATFWGRKAAAERVGESDFQEFMVRLKDFYDARPTPGPGTADPKLLGVVTVGHSFGSQVVLKATASLFEHEMTELGAAPSYLRDTQAPGHGATLTKPLQGFGDLVVLINPAVEAAVYQRLYALGQSFTYSADQTPVMFTVSANDDGPRHRLFEWGRIAGEWFTGKPAGSEARERNMERKALGFFDEQVTHQLVPQDASTRLHATTYKSQPEPGCSGRSHCEYTWYEKNPPATVQSQEDSLTAGEYSAAEVKKILEHDFSAFTEFDDVILRPTRGAIAHQAFIVAAADPGVITGHNGMFSDPLIHFLVKYIGFVEARKFLPLVVGKDPSIGAPAQ